MYPTDNGASVSDYVKRSLEIIDDSGRLDGKVETLKK